MRYALALLTVMAATTIARAAEQIDIPVGEDKLHATLYRPAGSGPFPSVVALHGCNGLMDRAGQFRAVYADWGEKLAAAGFAVLFPDSFASRGLGPQCTVQKRSVRPFRERVSDANAARDWLQQQPWIRTDRVSLLGWSHGAITALWAVRPRLAPKNGQADFRAAIAFYPNCRRPREAAWTTRIPMLLLVGGADDWTPARECEQMAAEARDRSARIALVKYQGAHHYFDRSDLPVTERTGIAYTPDGSGKVHVGGDPQARADALKRVPEWLSR